MLGERDDCPLMPGVDDRVALPVSDPASRLDDLRPLLDAHVPLLAAAVVLGPLFPGSHMSMKISARGLVGVDSLIDCLVRNGACLLVRAVPLNLLGVKILTDQDLDQLANGELPRPLRACARLTPT